MSGSTSSNANLGVAIEARCSRADVSALTETTQGLHLLMCLKQVD